MKGTIRSKGWLLCFITLGAISACVLSMSLLGQAVSGGVVGTITDTSGAVIPQAKVTIKNVGTGVARSTTTDASGNYSFPYVVPASYSVAASKQGFATVTQHSVMVSVNSTVRVDLTLRVGRMAQIVTVSSETPLLQTASAQTGTNITSTEAEALPLPNNRNFQGLMVLTPGVTEAVVPTHSRFFNVQTTLQVPVDGQNSLLDNFQIEGISDNERTGLLQVYVPPIEALKEVNVSTSNYDAEQGSALGAVTDAIFKSGTNQWHGSAYEWWKGNALVTRSFFQVGAAGKPYVEPPFDFNQFGGTIGGPIRKNKTFVFFDYQRVSDTEGQFQELSVPTAAMRNGDFSDPALTEIFNPATGNPNGTGRTQFPGNRIPSSQLNPIAAKLVDEVPLPNNNLTAAGTEKYVNNYLESTGFRQILPSFDLKVDQYQGADDHIDAWMSHMWPLTSQGPAYGLAGGPIYGGFEGTGTDETWLAGISWDHVLSPTMFTENRIGLTRYRNVSDPTGFGDNLAAQVGIPGVNISPFTSGQTEIINEGFSDPMIGESTAQPWQREETNFTYASGWTKITGNHNLKWGGSVFRVRDDLLSTNVYGVRGQWSFGVGPTALNSSSAPATGFGNEFASFMLGIPSQVGRDLALEFPALRQWQYALYVNDKWQVRPKLTANIGLRWDDYAAFTPQFSHGFSQYDPSTNSLIISGYDGNPESLGMQSRLHDFAPRVGLAYRVTGNTVVRAGFGMGYGPFEDNSYAYNYPVLQTNVFTNQGNDYGPAILPNGGASTFQAGLPGAIVAPIPSNGIIPADTPALLDSSYKVVNTHYLDPYLEAWNLAVERALPGGWVLNLAYAGNHGVHIPIQDNLNAGLITGAGKLGQPEYKLFGRTASTTMYFATTTSSYNSLQATLTHRFAAGYTVSLAYTYAKAMGIGGECGENSCGPTYYVDYKRNWSQLDFNRTQVLTGAYTWQLPLQKFHAFQADVPGFIMRGWQLDGVASLYTGLPFAFGCSCTLDTPGNGDSPNQVGPFTALHGIGAQHPWFNTSAFAEPAVDTFGNVGVMPFNGPNTFELDASLVRQFRLTERVGLQLRTDWISATNTPQFGLPGATFGSSNFGEVTSTLQVGNAIQDNYGGNRIIDIAAKLTF
jgi:hypothetical protein